MRLIDEEKLMEDMQKTITEQSGTIDWMNLIYRQPTAYDVDKVAEQLDDYLFDKYCVEGDSKIYEIVKGGGVDAESRIKDL